MLQLAPVVPCAEVDGLLCVLRDNLGKADAFISTAEELIVRSWSGGGGRDDPEGDDSVSRRRNHVEHLVEAAKLAVRAADYTGQELEALAQRRQGA
jgi:hypothetical protein